MKANWPQIFDWVLAHEGGFVNHPDDPGGPTNQGVTQRTYDAYRKRHGMSARSVRSITSDEVRTIYRQQYWDRVQGDELPSGVDYAVYDFAVNSGVSRSAKYLQRIVGVSQDGVIGEMTLDAVAAMPPEQIVERLCDDRMAFLKRLRHWNKFGRGWTRRVSNVRKRATDLVYNTPEAVSAPTEATGNTKAEGPEKLTATLVDTLKNPRALSAGGAAVGSVASMASGDGPVPYAIAAVLVLGALLAVFLLVRRGAD